MSSDPAPILVGGVPFESIAALRQHITGLSVSDPLDTATQLWLHSLLLQSEEQYKKVCGEGTGGVVGFRAEEGAEVQIQFAGVRRDGEAAPFKWGRCVSAVHRKIDPSLKEPRERKKKRNEDREEGWVEAKRSRTDGEMAGQTVVVGGGEHLGVLALAELLSAYGDVLAVIPQRKRNPVLCVFGSAESAAKAVSASADLKLQLSIAPDDAYQSALSTPAVQIKQYDPASSAIALPAGLELTPDFLSPQEEREIVEWVEAQGWHDEMLRRKVQQYGPRYGYAGKGRGLEPPRAPIPEFLKEKVVRKMMTATGGAFALTREPDQLIINKYEPGEGIGSHLDRIELFDDTISVVCLGADVVMDFTDLDGKEEIPVLLPRRSYYTIKGESRFSFLHGISQHSMFNWAGCDMGRGPRISLTFRKCLPEALERMNSSPSKPKQKGTAEIMWTSGLGDRWPKLAGKHVWSAKEVAEELLDIAQRQADAGGDEVVNPADAAFLYALLRRTPSPETDLLTKGVCGVSVKEVRGESVEGGELHCTARMDDGTKLVWAPIRSARRMFGWNGEAEFLNTVKSAFAEEVLFSAPTSGRGTEKTTEQSEEEAALDALEGADKPKEKVKFVGTAEWTQTNGMTQREQDRAMHRAVMRRHGTSARAAFWLEYSGGQISDLPTANESPHACCFVGEGSVGDGGPLSKRSVDSGSPFAGTADNMFATLGSRVAVAVVKEAEGHSAP
eukprot:Hpha_TRINITY_DN15976_c0_g2::TRINITY_DN15976_c0_g2_i1::g.73894::m.73894/K10770/ALKBH8; alkylated DNA repair protein alkB homolog 8